MARIAVREAVFATLADTLSAELPDVPVERNRLSDLSDPGEAPRLVLRDGASSPDDGDGAGGDLLTLSALLEGYVSGPEDGLGALVNDLHGRAVVALCGDETEPGKILSGPGGLTLLVREGGVDPEFTAVRTSDVPIAAFYLDLTVELRVAVGQRFVETP